MTERFTTRVSCKAALYSPSSDKVLLTAYGDNGYGLPGGHLEFDETPDQTVTRELFEELGVSGVDLKRRDFWFHHNGKLILGYTGVLKEDAKLVIDYSEISQADWVLVADIKAGRIQVRSYDEFIINYQPEVVVAA